MKTAEIKLTIELDDNNVPEKITWESTDAQNKEALPVKSMMLSLWDHNYKNTLRIDLWTKDMPVDEMKRFFYETLQTMGDSFLRATGETNIVEDLRDYCAHFADKMEISQDKK
jgi:gliding motility-associated protein GldC